MRKIKFTFVCMIFMYLCGCGISEDDKIYDSLTSNQGQSHVQDSSVSAAAAVLQTEHDPDKRYLTISKIGIPDNTEIDYTYNAAKRYMELHPDCVIIVELTPTTERLEYKTITSTAIMAGQSADIIDIYYLFSKRFIQNGFFVDLYEFMQADETFDPADYYMNVISAFETDSKLYGLCQSFTPYGAFALRNDISDEFNERFGEEEGYSYNDAILMCAAAAADDPRDRYFHLYFNRMQIFTFNYDSLIDFDRREAHFSDPDIKRLLELAKSIPVKDMVYEPSEPSFKVSVWSDQYYRDFSNKKYIYMLMEAIDLSNFSPVLFMHKGSIFTEPRILPTEQGNYLFVPGSTYAIANTCEDKGLAWDFLKYCIEEKEIPKNPLKFGSWTDLYMSVNKKMNEAHWDTYLNHEYELGETVYNLTTADDKDVTINRAKQFIMKANEQCRIATSVYTDLDAIIWPDMYLYLTDKQSADVTLANIQSKVEIYLNE